MWWLERHAEQIRWAHDDSVVAVWGSREYDEHDDMETVDRRRICWGPIGAEHRELYTTNVVYDAAWLAGNRLAILRASKTPAAWRASDSIEVLVLPGGETQACLEGIPLSYARIQSTPLGGLFLHDRQFPSNDGHTVSILDPDTLATIGTLTSSPPGTTARTWLAPDAAHHIVLTDAPTRVLRLDGTRPLPLPHAGAAWVTWLTPSRFVVRDVKHPACTTMLLDAAREQPLLTIDHHADVNVTIDLHADGQRALVQQGQSSRLVDLTTGTTREVARSEGALWLPGHDDELVLLLTHDRSATLATLDLATGREHHVAAVPARSEMRSPLVLEHTPGRQYVCVRWWAREGQSLAAFPVAKL